MSLSRPFLAAGAEAVVGTLLRVRDAESSSFFEAFYSALGRGGTLAASLGAAKRARIAAGAPPAAWSGFVLLGAGEAAPRARGGTRTAVVAALVCAAGGLMAVGLRLRRARARGRTAAPREP